jgi:cytochrome b pre-mRNA-processing protein 3
MFGLFRNKVRESNAERVYSEITAQARQPFLYIDLEVPDTVEGRFDMMVLHVFLVLRRLADAGAPLVADAQAVCDRFFTEMDRALREMGVGDLTVPKRMKSIGELYAGCSAAYAAGLAEHTDEVLIAALSRNVYDLPGEISPFAPGLAAYVRRVEASLQQAAPAAILTGHVPFPRQNPTDRSAA